MRSFKALIVLGAILACAIAAQAGTVTVSGPDSSLNTGVSGGNTQAGSWGALLPFPPSTSQIASDGVNSATDVFDFAHSAFSVDMTHYASVQTHTPGGVDYTGASSAESWGAVVFTVDTALTYAASGHYSSPGSGGLVSMFANLYDLTSTDPITGDPLTLLHGFQISPAGTPLVLGPTDDFFGNPGGSLTGTLVAGHQYRWEYDALITAGTSPASASGNISLSFGGNAAMLISEPPPEPTPVPLPAAAWGAIMLLLLPVLSRSRCGGLRSGH